jgi:predicted small metal-binding protein
MQIALERFRRYTSLHKHAVCGCGHVVHADSDDEMVTKMQKHMKEAHGKEITREEVLAMAHEHQH